MQNISDRQYKVSVTSISYGRVIKWSILLVTTLINARHTYWFYKPTVTVPCCSTILSQKLIRGPYFCFFLLSGIHDAALRLAGDATQRPLRRNPLVTTPLPAACATTTLEEGRSSDPPCFSSPTLSLYHEIQHKFYPWQPILSLCLDKNTPTPPIDLQRRDLPLAYGGRSRTGCRQSPRPWDLDRPMAESRPNSGAAVTQGRSRRPRSRSPSATRLRGCPDLDRPDSPDFNIGKQYFRLFLVRSRSRSCSVFVWPVPRLIRVKGARLGAHRRSVQPESRGTSTMLRIFMVKAALPINLYNVYAVQLVL
jgi:hypothetical protein